MTEKDIERRTVITKLPIQVTDPAPLGLIGLGVAALVLATADLGVTSAAKSLLIPWVLFFGATAQLIAGLMEFKRDNIFGCTVFTTYAMTMYAIALTVAITVFTDITFDITYYGYGLVAILIFSIIATVASLMINKTLLLILLFVDGAVIVLIAHYLFGADPLLAGIFLLLTSVGSFYAAAAILLNTMAQKTVLSLGKPLWKP